MTQDYAKPSTTKNRAKPAAKGGRKNSPAKKGAANKPRSGASRVPDAPPPRSKFKLIALLILLLGIFAGGIYFLLSVPETNTPEPTPSTKASPEKSTSEKAKQSKPAPAENKTSEQRFKFYDLLPETEVIPPKVDSYRYKEKSTSNDFYYVVQTGSFRSKADAERQKATIAFQGLKASIKQIEGSNGSTWYRVMCGPYYSRSKMNSALDKLVNIRIEPLVKKVKKQS